MKKTIVLGASPNPDRYAYQAVARLTAHGHEAIPLGPRPGEIAGIAIQAGEPAVEEVDTVTLYIGEARQPEYYDYILSLKPRRVIFNPGAENPAFARLLREHNIVPEEACTLVLLATGQY
jgi:uncharacterized protein